MSEQTEKQAAKQLHADDLRKRQQKHRRQAPIWQILSFVLHMIGALALVLFTPLREIVIPEKKPTETIMSAKRIEELSENVQRVKLNELLERLQELQVMLHNMEFMKNEILKDYDTFAEHEQEKSRESIKELFEHMISEQEKTIENQAFTQETIAQTEDIVKNKDLTSQDVVNELNEKLVPAIAKFYEVETSQANVQSLFDKVSNQAQLIGLNQTAEATEKARDLQLDANIMQREAQKKFNERRSSSTSYKTTLEQIASAKAQVEKAETEKKNLETAKETAAAKAKDADAKIKEHTQNVAKLEKTLAEQQKQLEKQQAETQKAKDNNRSANDQKAAAQKEQQAAKEVKATEANLNRERIRLTQSTTEKKRNEDAITRNENAIAKKVEQIATLKNTLATREAKKEAVDNALNTGEAAKAQAEATEAQNALVELTRVLAKKAAEEEAQLVKKAQETQPVDPLTVQNMSHLDIVESYEMAQTLEIKIAESYRDIKAAEVAMLRKMSYESASTLTDVAKPVRIEADKEALLENPRTEEAFNKQKEETANVIRETQNIVAASEVLMKSAMEIVQLDGTDHHAAQQKREQRLQKMYELSDLERQITQAASEDADERSKDMSELMTMVSDIAAGGEEKAPEPEKTKIEVKLDGEKQVAYIDTPTPVGMPVLDRSMDSLFPGNIIGESDISADWMYLNSWYTIGPFPNPDRVNIRRKFPPESLVDLDAVYVGKNDREVRWVFEQAKTSEQHRGNRALVVPQSSEEYGIWYAYTEVFLDEACDLWIAVGSDDRSDVWLNDVHIWGSSNQLKSWNISEGYRKVHFQKGRNRILTRVENGWHVLGWSICIGLNDNAKQ